MWSYGNDLSPHFRTNYSESQALGLGKQSGKATHSGKGGVSLRGRQREAGLYGLEASALMSLLIVLEREKRSPNSFSAERWFES